MHTVECANKGAHAGNIKVLTAELTYRRSPGRQREMNGNNKSKPYAALTILIPPLMVILVILTAPLYGRFWYYTHFTGERKVRPRCTTV